MENYYLERFEYDDTLDKLQMLQPLKAIMQAPILIHGDQLPWAWLSPSAPRENVIMNFNERETLAHYRPCLEHSHHKKPVMQIRSEENHPSLKMGGVYMCL